VFFVGGFGTMWDFPLNEHVQRLQIEVYEKGGVIGAVCHGPIALANTKLSTGEYLVAGKEVGGFTEEEEGQAGMKALLPVIEGAGQSCEEVLSARGGKFKKTGAWGSHVTTDTRIVTGQNPASAAATGAAIVALFL
jgi:putative intracellular protease/amidase